MAIAKNKDVKLLMFISGIIMLPFLILFLFFIALNIFMSMFKDEPPVIENSLKSEIIIKAPASRYSYITTFDFNEDRSAIYYLVYSFADNIMTLYRYDLKNDVSKSIQTFYISDYFTNTDFAGYMAHGDDGHFYFPIIKYSDTCASLTNGVILSYDVKTGQVKKYKLVYKDFSVLDEDSSKDEFEKKLKRFKNSICREFLSDNDYQIKSFVLGSNYAAFNSYEVFPMSFLVGKDNTYIPTDYCTKEQLKAFSITEKVRDFRNQNCHFSSDPIYHCEEDPKVGVKVKEYSWADGLDGPYHEAIVLYYKGKDFQFSLDGESLSGFFTDKYGDIVVKDLKGNIVKLSAE